VAARAVVDLVVARELLDVVEVLHCGESWRLWIVMWCKEQPVCRCVEGRQVSGPVELTSLCRVMYGLMLCCKSQIDVMFDIRLHT